MKISVHLCLRQHYSRQQKGGSCPSVHHRMNKQKVVHLCNGILLRLKKEGNPVTCYNTDGPGGHYANEISQYRTIPLI